MFKRLYSKSFAILTLLGVTFGAQSQVSKLDTIDLQSVTVYHKRTISGLRPGVKAITLDTMAIYEKAGMSLSELLHENSPIFIKTYGRGAKATVSIRGTASSHTNVYWNGIRINSPMSGEADFSQIPLYFIDDVAIHFGASSMSFGSGGLGGSVNLSSAPNWSKDFGTSLYQTIGSYGTYTTAIKANYGKGKLRGQTRIFRESAENDFSYINIAKLDRPLEVQQNADYRKSGLLQELYYRPNSTGILSAKLWVQENQRGIPKLMSNYAVNEHNRQEDQMLNSVVKWERQSEMVKWELSSGLSHQNIHYNFKKESVEGNELPVIKGQSSSLSWINRVGFSRNLLPWLAINSQGEISSHQVSSHEERVNIGYSKNQTYAGLRTSLNATVSEKLSASFFVGQEVFDGDLTPISYSVSTEFRILEGKDLFAKGSFSQNHKQPSLNDLYWQPGGNPDLKPEESLSWEGGFVFSTHKGDFSLDIEAGVFASQITNWIMWLPHLNGYWEPINLKEVSTKGAELSVSSEFPFGAMHFRILGRYSHTLSTIENAGGVMRSDSHGNQLPFIPVHSGGLVVNALWRGFHAVYSFTHFSERYTTTSNNPNSTRIIYPYYMSNITLGYNFKLLKKGMGVQFRIDNLLNENYQTIHWRPMPGRNYNLVIRVDI